MVVVNVAIVSHQGPLGHAHSRQLGSWQSHWRSLLVHGHVPGRLSFVDALIRYGVHGDGAALIETRQVVHGIGCAQTA